MLIVSSMNIMSRAEIRTMCDASRGGRAYHTRGRKQGGNVRYPFVRWRNRTFGILFVCLTHAN